MGVLMKSQIVGLEGVIDKRKMFLFLRRLSINHVIIDGGNNLNWSFGQQVFVLSTPDRSVVHRDAWIKRRLVVVVGGIRNCGFRFPNGFEVWVEFKLGVFLFRSSYRSWR